MRVDFIRRCEGFHPIARVVRAAILLAVTAVLFADSTGALANLETCLGDNIGPQARFEACTLAIDGGDLDENDLGAAHRARGAVYNQRGEHEKALSDFLRAYQIDRTDIAALTGTADSLFAWGNIEKARQFYRLALLQAPQDPDARQGCTDVLLAMGLEDQTEQALDHQCAIVIFDAQAHAEATRDTGTEQLDVRVTRALVRDLVWQMNRHIFNFDLDFDFDKAAHAYSMARRIDAEFLACINPISLMWLLEAYDQSVRPEAYADDAIRPTLDELNDILAYDPLDSIALRERGLLYAQVLGIRQAIDDFDDAIQTDPHPEQILALKGMALSADLFRPEPAFAVLEQAMAAGADGPYLHLSHGSLLGKLGHYEEAIAELTLVLDGLPENPEDPVDLRMKREALSFRGGAKHHLANEYPDVGRVDMNESVEIRDALNQAHDVQCGRN